MDKLQWVLLGALAILIGLCIGRTVYAEPMGREQFCQALTADAARVAILRREKRITYEQTLASIPDGLPTDQVAQLRRMIDLAFQTSEDPMGFAVSISQACASGGLLPAKYDDTFIHRAGEHHLAQPTIDRMYAAAWQIYTTLHPEATKPDALPKIGFATSQGICAAIKSKLDRDCALAITGGERAGYPLPDGVDILLDETLDYDGNLLAGGILLHEFVHYFQYVNLGPISVCEVAIEREHEAYKLQAGWLAAHGGGEYVARVMAASAKNRCYNQP